MPLRITPLVTDYYYHVFNRGVNKREIFSSHRDYQRAIEITRFYQRDSLPFSFSRLLKLLSAEQEKVWRYVLKKPKTVEIVAYCLMPNHFHFILHQKTDKGISHFMANWENSYSHYYNTKYKRIGHLFQGQFKAVRVISDNQLLHLSRYIHLNPYTSSLVGSVEDCEKYPWSSLGEYLAGKPDICDNSIVLDQFSSPDDYKIFVNDQAAYQRELHFVKDFFD